MSQINLFNKAIMEMQDMGQYFKTQTYTGKIIVELNYYNGGLTSKRVAKEVTERTK